MEEYRSIRKLLIIGVGSSANVHLLRHIALKYPRILFDNKIVLIETSKDMLTIAREKLYSIYKDHYRRLLDNEKDLYPRPYEFREQLERNFSILLNGEGGATLPERGLGFFQQRREKVLGKIMDIYDKYDLTGIVVLGNAGKGTATLVSPALIHELKGEKEVVFGFISLPLRMNKTEKRNAAKTAQYIITNNVPAFLLDYERARDIYYYKTGEKRDRARIGEIYRVVIEPLSTTLSTIIEALNWGDYCNPPLDWSDFRTLFELRGKVGTITFSQRADEDDFLKNWLLDIENQRLLKTKTFPSSTSVVTILKSGAGIPIKLVEDISVHFNKRYHSKMHSIYSLELGQGFTAVCLIYGFDIMQIEPPLVEKSFWKKLRGG